MVDDSSDYEEPTPSCTLTERHTSTITSRHPFPPPLVPHYQRQMNSSMASSKCTVAASFPAVGPNCRQSLLLVDNNNLFHRMMPPNPNKMSFSTPSSSSNNGHHLHHHHNNHCPPGDSPSLLLYSSGSASAYATSSLLRCSSATAAHYPPPPQPPNFPPPRRRQRKTQEQRRRGTKGAEMGRRKCVRLRFWLALAFLLLAAFLILPLLLWLTVLNSTNETTIPSADGSIDDYFLRISSLKSPQSASSSSTPIPSPLPLNRPIHFNLPGHHLLFTQITIPFNSLLWLNFTLPPNSRMILFARQTLRPSPGQFDWQRILVGEKLHLVKGESRLALVNHFVQAGKWHFGFLNDRSEIESIGLKAGLEQNVEEEKMEGTICKFDCLGKGQCREGKCICHPGFSGPFCEETVCPVLCSGQGIFSGGQCHCHEGFKGVECELPIGYCADCGGHGQCQSTDGVCICEAGWTGENCGQRECPGRGCSKEHGICIEGKCFCEPGWTGQDCGKKVLERMKQKTIGNEERMLTAECPANCSGKGECVEGECRCQWGWTGSDCGKKNCPFGCEKHGKCGEDGKCECTNGWSGENCQIELCMKNCSQMGQCLLRADGWHCECQKGRFGENCEFGWESNCEDGIDNDEDGLTDCEDSTECCAHPSCSSDPLCLGPILSKELFHNQPVSSSSTFADRFRFLFDGGHLSVQRYADMRLLDENRLSILRGRILSEKGGPLIGVRVSDANNAQQGFSLSRAGTDSAGEFELAVNGGGTVHLQFVRQPYGRLVQSFFVPANKLLDVGIIWMDRVAHEEMANPPFSPGCLHSIEQLQFRPIIFMPSSSPLPPPSYYSLSSFPLARLALDSRIVSLAIPIHRGHFLVYSSNRANSSRSNFRIQLLGEIVPTNLLLIHFELEIGGKRFSQLMVPKANLEFQFGWNGENSYWQKEEGILAGKVSIGFQFADCAQLIWQYFPLNLPSPPPISPSSPMLPSSPIWSISSVHRFHPKLGIIEKGDGEIQYLMENSNRILRNLEAFKIQKSQSQSQPLDLAATPDGSIYLGQSELVQRIWPNGHKDSEEIIKLEPMDSAHPYFLAVHPSISSLYISLPLRRQIWRIIEGEGHTVVSDAQRGLTFPKGIGFDLDGNLLALDGRKLVQLDGKGTIKRVLVNDGPWRPLRDCARHAPINDLILEWPTALSVDPINGHIFLLDSSSTIFRLDLRLGIASLIVGTQKGCGPETSIQSIAFCPIRGILYMAMTDGKRIHTIKSVESAANYPPGIPQTIVGQQKSICDCDSPLCVCDDAEEIVEGHKAHLNMPRALATLPNGNLIIADQGNGKLKMLEMAKGAEFDEGRSIWVVNNAATDEQFEFDKDGRHLRTRSLLTGIEMREMEYGQGGGLLGMREGGRELWRIALNEGNDGGEWSIDQGEKRLLRVKAEMEEGIVHSKIITSTLPHPILLNFADSQLLQSITFGSKMTSFDYEPGTGLANSAKFPGENGEWTLDGIKIVGEGRWKNRIWRRDIEQIIELEEAANGELAMALSGGGRMAQTSFRLSHSSWPHFGRQLSVSSPISLLWHFDYSTNPQMLPWQRAMSRQRLSLTKNNNSSIGMGGTMRAEWRVQLRRPGVAKIVQKFVHYFLPFVLLAFSSSFLLNGRNQFSVDFDPTKMADSIFDPFDNKLLGVKYSNEGKLRGIEWPNGLKMEIEMENGGQNWMRRFKWEDGKMEWTERRNGDGRQIEQFLENGQKTQWRRVEMADDEKALKVILPNNSTFIWSIDSDSGTILLNSPSGERHSLAQSLPIFHPNFSQFSIHSVESVKTIGNGNEKYSPKLQWIEAGNDGNDEWELKKTGKNWMEIVRDEWGQIVGLKQTNESLSFEFKLDEAGRAISVHSPLFTRQTVFAGPLPVATNFSSNFGGNSQISSLFNWTGPDQMFMPSAFGLQIDGGMIDWRRIEYEEMGQMRSGEGQFRFKNDGTGQRTITGDLFRLEFQFDQLGRPIQKKLFFPPNSLEPTFMASFEIGQNGEWKNENWINGKEEWTGTREFNANGQLIYQRSGSAGNEWRIGYDLDQRPNQLNGIRLKLGEGGIPIRYGEIGYETEETSGWTRKRGRSTFQFDGLGQPIIFMEGQKQIDYVFDEKGRIIGRRNSGEEDGDWLQMHYGDPMLPNLLTHFWHSSNPTEFWRLFWTKNEEPFLVQNAKGDKQFVLLTDSDNSIRFWLDMNGRIVHESWYSPQGERHGTLSTANLPIKSFPLGFGSQFYDSDAKMLIFGPSINNNFLASRPFDTMIGRFMTNHFGMGKLDWLRPELLFDPFGWYPTQREWSQKLTLANSLAKLLPIPSFANWMESPLGLPKIPHGFGLTEMERLTQEIGIFDGRITSLNSEHGDWGKSESWASILLQSNSNRGEECRGNEGIWEWRRNGTKIIFKNIHNSKEENEHQNQIGLAKLLNGVEMLEEEDLDKLLKEMAENGSRMPFFKLAKKMEQFEEDKAIVDELVKDGMEMKGLNCLVDVKRKLVQIVGPSLCSFIQPITIEYIL